MRFDSTRPIKSSQLNKLVEDDANASGRNSITNRLITVNSRDAVLVQVIGVYTGSGVHGKYKGVIVYGSSSAITTDTLDMPEGMMSAASQSCVILSKSLLSIDATIPSDNAYSYYTGIIVGFASDVGLPIVWIDNDDVHCYVTFQSVQSYYGQYNGYIVSGLNALPDSGSTNCTIINTPDEVSRTWPMCVPNISTVVWMGFYNGIDPNTGNPLIVTNAFNIGC